MNISISLMVISRNIFETILPIWYDKEEEILYINILPIILILLLTIN